MKLYEYSVSTKLLLTGFIALVCVVGVLALFATYDLCRGADGSYDSFSIDDIHVTIGGSDTPVLMQAADNPGTFGLESAGPDELTRLRTWCADGAPYKNMPEIVDILQNSGLELPFRGTSNEQYEWLRSLAMCHDRLSGGRLMAGVGLYLALVSLAFLGLGLMFVRTSLFEKTKVLVVSAAFAFAVLVPACLWRARTHPVMVYPMLLAGLLLALCFVVFALVALTDIWFRRPIT
jgi:hypothetical protein